MADGTPESGTLMGTGNENPPVNNPPAWMAQLSDDLKANEGLTSFATISDLGKSYLDLKGKSEGSISVPGENATDEEKSSFYNALGRPESPDAYTFDRPKLPEGVTYDEEQEKSFRAYAHEQGLSQGQAKAMYDLYHQNVNKAYEEYASQVVKAKEEAETALKKEWGVQFNGNVERARRTLQTFADEATIQFFEVSRLGDNPVIVKLFSKIGEALSEDKLVDGSPAMDKERERTQAGRPMLDFPSMEKK